MNLKIIANVLLYNLTKNRNVSREYEKIPTALVKLTQTVKV